MVPVFHIDSFPNLQHKISPVNPVEYGDRFFSFLQAVMRGGGGGQSFV
jgi:1-phosphatidylinositol-4-phosphate 5-kinase